jgi:hypothetical protein
MLPVELDDPAHERGRDRLVKAQAHRPGPVPALVARHGQCHTAADALLAAAERGKFGEFLADRWAPDMEYITGRGVRGNRRRIFNAMDTDVAAGVRQRHVSTVASQNLTIWQMEIINPLSDPHHCPPGVIYVLSLRGDQVRRLRLFHPDRDVAKEIPHSRHLSFH